MGKFHRQRYNYHDAWLQSATLLPTAELVLEISQDTFWNAGALEMVTATFRKVRNLAEVEDFLKRLEAERVSDQYLDQIFSIDQPESRKFIVGLNRVGLLTIEAVSMLEMP